MDRRKTILAVLLVLFAIVFFYRINHPFEQERVDRLTFTQSGRSRGVVTVRIDEPKPLPRIHGRKFHLLMDMFLHPPLYSKTVIKNPFSEKKASPPPEKRPPVEKNVVVEKNPLDVINEELRKFTVLGTYESEGEKAIFLARKKEMLVVQIGDRIDGKYLVENISDTSITIKAEKINETVHIDMTDF